jgi:hypothetical protein
MPGFSIFIPSQWPHMDKNCNLMIPMLLWLPVLSACSATGSTSNPETGTTKPVWTSPQVEGHWKQVDFEIVEDIPFLDIVFDPNEPQIAMEQGPFELYRGGDLIFEGDSVYRMNYPLEILTRSGFTLDSGYMHTESEDRFNAYPIELVNDTLFVYVKGSYGPEYMKEAYVRTDFDDSIVSVLKKYTVNYPELAGTWILMRDYWYDYGTHYWLEFPHAIPDTIKISREQFLAAQDNGNSYYMSTDRKKRAYTFYYDYPFLHLTPGEWYKGDDPWIHFGVPDPVEEE